MRTTLMEQYERRKQDQLNISNSRISQNIKAVLPADINFDIYQVFYNGSIYVFPVEDGTIHAKSLARLMNGPDGGDWYKRKKDNDDWELFGSAALILIPFTAGAYVFPTEDGNLDSGTLGRLVGGPNDARIVRRNPANNGWLMIDTMISPLYNVPTTIGNLIYISGLLYWVLDSDTNIPVVGFSDNLDDFSVENFIYKGSSGYYLQGDLDKYRICHITEVGSAGNACGSIMEHGDGRISYVTVGCSIVPLNWIDCGSV